MYLHASRLHYNLRCVCVFQKAISKKLFKLWLVDILYHTYLFISTLISTEVLIIGQFFDIIVLGYL